MTHNEIGFIQHEGIASNGVAWELQCPPGTRTYDTDFSAAAFYRFLDGDRYELLFRAKGRLAPCPEIGFPGCVGGAEFYSRFLDSRRLHVYYTTVRPIAERPVFAQRGWRRRYPTLARALDAQSRRAAETGEYVAKELSP
uniref:Protein m169 n=1 Tax=Mastomys natalensis cytomegalovirus 1 TaxID=2973541 RepID=A0A9Y1IL05_9BETA|nr:protein m169 [Mastomys natalensis cytomegalovirus 1]WEG69018.1 protein m169 [Mastomys natalensis cytomegalovirus 1]WEG71246.1 protein m169 [Mastomys natalensis cytomegalovirus 1]